MAYKQLISPDIAINEQAGLCLQYARRAFGRPAIEPTAWQAWQNAKYKHQDRNFPKGVSVPVWFDWWGRVNRDIVPHRYGHVAVRTPDGLIWSSPLTGTGRAWFNSVDDLTRAFGGGMTYVGWSEDISGGRVVINEEDEVIEDTDNEFGRWSNLSIFIRGRTDKNGALKGLTRAEFKRSAVGKTWLRAVEILMDDQEASENLQTLRVGKMALKDKWQQQIYSLQNKLSKTTTTEADKKLQAIKDILKGEL